MLQTILDKINFKEKKIPILIAVLLFTFSSIVLLRANYSAATFPIGLIVILSIANIGFKDKKDFLKDLFLFPIMFIEIEYCFQLLTLASAT